MNRTIALFLAMAVLLAHTIAIYSDKSGNFAYYNVNEILSTIMLNIIAVQGMNYLLRGPLIDPEQLQAASRIPQTARLMREFDLPRLIASLERSASLEPDAQVASIVSDLDAFAGDREPDDDQTLLLIEVVKV